MFYCTPCADKKKWPKSIFQSYGRCEICSKHGDCNEVPASRLPFTQTGEGSPIIFRQPTPKATINEESKDVYDAPKVSGYVLQDEMGMTSSVDVFEGWKIIKPLMSQGKEKLFWLSIKRAKNCLFSRRNGYEGKLIWGYSICLRLFGKTIL